MQISSIDNYGFYPSVTNGYFVIKLVGVYGYDGGDSFLSVN